MENITEYKRRFYNLMESTLGDVKPLISEQNEKKIPNLQVRVLTVKNPETFGDLDNHVEVTTDTNSILFGKCMANTDIAKRNNCFSLKTTTMENGTYPPKSFSGEILVYHKGLEYRCKLNKPCIPKSLKPSF